MIAELKLKLGALPGAEPLTVETPPSVTIFVGPNNAGKTQALREIFEFCNSGQINAAWLILDRTIFAGMDADAAQREFEATRVAARQGEAVAEGHSILRIGTERLHVPPRKYVAALTSPNERLNLFAQWYLRHFTLNLDGPSRIGLVNPQSRGDLKNPSSPLARLLTDDQKRRKLRKIIHDALGMYFAIDAQAGDQLSVRFGATEPPDERSFNDEAIAYMRAARSTDAVSDGVKAFTGILLQLNTGDPKVITIDEPEAFLHPSLTLRLGKELAKAAATESKHVFAATHSAQFVMGAILSGAKVNIVRLTYANDVGTARLLSSGDLTTLMQDPLLRSVGVLAALFYDYVVVGEADADRAFYQEINERLLAEDDPRGVPHTLFLNAQGKDTIARIIEPLRKLGIPAAGIADIDILREGGQKWTAHLKACAIPTAEHQPYGTRRGNVFAALVAQNADFKTAGGVVLLTGQDRQAADNLLDDLDRYGLFVVRRGEVEAWLSDLDVSRSKVNWLRSIFERMGSDPNANNYVKPAAGDIWDFVGEVGKWLADPTRRGIPT